MALEYQILIRDADGVDSVAQCRLPDAGYRHVTIFCSAGQPRNYHGPWAIHRVHAPFCARD